MESKRLIRVEGGVVSAIKTAEDGNGLIVRVYNPSDNTARIRLTVPGKEIKAWRCDFLENDLAPIAVKAAAAEYDLAGRKVCSIRILAQ